MTNNINMKEENIFLTKTLIFIFIFYIISVVSIYSFQEFLPSNTGNLYFKQTCYYILGLIIVFVIHKFKFDKILKYSYLIYILNVLLLLFVLLFGEEINGAKAWFSIPFIGSFQPSEFMKIGIILMGCKIISSSKIRFFKDEVILILKLFLIVLVPSVLTFLEPDTGSVITYLVIFVTMLILSGIRMRFFVLFISLFVILFGVILYLYYFNQELFVNLLGSNFFYRLDRIFDWQNKSGMQLENSILAISSSGIFGNGIKSIPIYYPEGQTDFIFTSFVSCFGFIGALILIVSIVLFDFTFIKETIKNDDTTYKVLVTCFVVAMLYQQVENIAMTVGLLPITGITLPFISYGGSSLISYMILLGIIFSKKNSLSKKTI